MSGLNWRRAAVGRWLRQLEAAGCEAVLVNTHHLAKHVMTFLEGWSPDGMQVHSVHEPGTAGHGGYALSQSGLL